LNTVIPILIIIILVSIFLISLIEFGDTSAQESEGFTDDVEALFDKGLALDGLGQYEEAISYYDKVLAIDPNNIFALGNKGLGLSNLGRDQEAIEYYDKVLAMGFLRQ
jgi:tetratricopeptide (TPR) repeat protein